MHSTSTWQTGPIVPLTRQKHRFSAARNWTVAAIFSIGALLICPTAFAALSNGLKPNYASVRTSAWLRARTASREARIARLLHKKEHRIPQPITLSPPIEGRVVANGFTNAQIFLVRPIPPETKRDLEEGAKLFAALRSKPSLDVQKTVIAPSNAITLQKALADIKAAMPKPLVRDMQVAQVGTLKIAPSGPLITKYTQRFLKMDPALIRKDLRGITDLIREDMMEQEKILGVGYLGSIQAIDFFGLVREAGGADVVQARKIAQAAVDQLWLTELCDYIAASDAKAEQITLKGGAQLTPEESWNIFYLTKFNNIDFDLQLRVLDVTTPGPRGEFRLWGEGDIVVAVPAFQERVYIPEGAPSGPIQITRLKNANGKERR